MSAYSDAVVALSPSGFWRMNEASGNLADSSGNGLTGTKNGSPTYGVNPGSISDGGSAISFSSVAGQDFFSMGTPAGLSLTGSWTISAWFMLGANPLTRNYDIVTSETLNASGFLIRVQSGGDVLIRTNQAAANTTLNASTGLTPGVWKNITVTYDGVNGKIYINGALVSGGTGALTAALANTANFTISDNTASSFQGSIGDVFVIKGTALLAAQIAALVQLGRSVQIPSQLLATY